MPTYEYRCEACGAEFERVQRITEDANPECLKCGEAEARRLVGSGNFILKGGGWYADLYSSVPKGGGSKAEGGGGTADEAGTTSGSKPETKLESKPSSSSSSSSSGSSGGGKAD